MKRLGHASFILVSLIATIAIGCSDKSSTSPDAGTGTNDGPATAADTPSPMDVPAAVDLATTIDGAGARDGSLDAGVVRDAIAAFDTGSAAVCGPFANGGSGSGRDALSAPSSTMSFFVSSQKNVTGNLGGLAGADQRCQTLAQAAGVPSTQWRAYLSVEHDPPLTGTPVNARDRIGSGPWHNAMGVVVATNLADLHSRTGDPSVLVDERGNMINGQWTSSPAPLEHDILTGSNSDGTLAAGKTCEDWTSELAPAGTTTTGRIARVGHSDGFGPQCSTATSPTDYTSWNSSHDNAGCNDTAPRGGAGRIYCFLVH